MARVLWTPVARTAPRRLRPRASAIYALRHGRHGRQWGGGARTDRRPGRGTGAFSKLCIASWPAWGGGARLIGRPGRGTGAFSKLCIASWPAWGGGARLIASREEQGALQAMHCVTTDLTMRLSGELRRDGASGHDGGEWAPGVAPQCRLSGPRGVQSRRRMRCPPARHARGDAMHRCVRRAAGCAGARVAGGGWRSVAVRRRCGWCGW